MKAIYLDCFSGLSGNMLLGAFIQAGVPVAWLEKELKKLPIADEFDLVVDEVSKNGIQAVYVDVRLMADKDVSCHDGQKKEGHATHHAHESHGHGHSHAVHAHRTMKDIRTMIETSALSVPVRQQALGIFEVIAAAEGKVHGKPADEVSFHEVGATDSIVDIVGTAICLDYLEIDHVFASTLNVGSGFVRCAHGLMPVPAPAVAELLKDWQWVQQGAEKELTTPTGAAVVKALADYSPSLPQGFATQQIAYGAGTWDLDIPNVVRLYVGEYQGAKCARQFILETNIDDMNPQIYGYLYDRLFAAGALDVWTTPIYMKKNRPAQQLSVLVDENSQAACAAIIFQETSSIGLRILPVGERLEAARHLAKVETRYGLVNCKVSAWQGQLVSVSAEYEDCRRLAEEQGVALKLIQQEALKVFHDRLGD